MIHLKGLEEKFKTDPELKKKYQKILKLKKFIKID